MDAIIKPFKGLLQVLIEDEQRRRNIDMRGMLAWMQSNAALPEFYRVPAQEQANALVERSAADYPPGELSSALQEAIKAVYGAWIRERHRSV